MNRILAIALRVCQAGQIIVLMGVVLFTAFMIHWATSPHTYAQVYFTGNSLYFSTDGPPQSGDSLDQLTGKQMGALLFIYIKTSGLLALSYLILRQVGRVLLSIHSLSTFGRQNIRCFRKIAHLLLITFLLQIISLESSKDILSVQLEVTIYPLIAALAAYVLAEIFREGNQLMEENQLTI